MSIKNKIKLFFGLVYAVLMTIITYPLGRLIYAGKGIWLIGERPNQAQDNGYHFFKYVRKNHPELLVYYVIEKGSPHLEKVAELGEVVYFGSFRHWLMYFGCKAVISTHIRKLLPSNNWRYMDLARHFKQKNKIIVFLQHGVIKDDIAKLYSERTRVDIFICGAKPEYDYVNEHYHYRNGEVKYTGLARYDALHDISVKKQILIMPTWRSWLLKPGYDMAGSEYVSEWNKVITDKRLIEAAKKGGYKIIFYLHSNLQFARDMFKSVDDAVIIARDIDYDVQTLLKESALLITDYSSVYFDFAYMRKPVLYFQFDSERHSAEHYKKGYFDYERDGFGKVAVTASELVDNFTEVMDEGVALSDKYNERIDGFFPLYDRNNCERIYNETVKICNRNA